MEAVASANGLAAAIEAGGYRSLLIETPIRFLRDERPPGAAEGAAAGEGPADPDPLLQERAASAKGRPGRESPSEDTSRGPGLHL